MSEFIIKLPVRWGDMDAFNHVSNVVYLRYIEDCRGQWMQSVPSHWQEADTGPVVANININYRRPLYWPETVEVTLVPEPPGRSSIKLMHEIRSAAPVENGEKTVYAEGSSTLVWIDKKTGQAVPLPSVIRELGAEG
ncbi:MAG TPA: thioesterase family protein [Wenzhouxiangella sp.]|nr:thioesterase family protein [Wenzhouxiangella sp.]